MVQRNTYPSGDDSSRLHPDMGSTSSGQPIGSHGQGTAESMQETAGQFLDQAREQTWSLLGSQKERAAQGLGSLTDALRQTSRQLHESDQGMVAQYVEGAASQLDDFSNYLRDADFNQVFDQVYRYARREPYMFLGAAFALGLAASRFFKSSAGQSQYNYDYQRRYDGGWRGNFTGSSFDSRDADQFYRQAYGDQYNWGGYEPAPPRSGYNYGHGTNMPAPSGRSGRQMPGALPGEDDAARALMGQQAPARGGSMSSTGASGTMSQPPSNRPGPSTSGRTASTPGQSGTSGTNRTKDDDSAPGAV